MSTLPEPSQLVGVFVPKYRMRDFINIVESENLVEGFGTLPSLEELLQHCDNVDQFINKLDGSLVDALFRGHYDGQTPNNVFMTDYVGHAREYADDDGRVDAYAYDPSDVLFFNDDRFNEMRRAFSALTDQQLAEAYKTALMGHRFADEFRKAFSTVKKLVRGGAPYSSFCGNHETNDVVVPLMQAYARELGKNIIAFHGSDYSDYGGQTEYVVGDVSKLTDLRKLFASVRGQA